LSDNEKQVAQTHLFSKSVKPTTERRRHFKWRQPMP